MGNGPDLHAILLGYSPTFDTVLKRVPASSLPQSTAWTALNLCSLTLISLMLRSVTNQPKQL